MSIKILGIIINIILHYHYGISIFNLVLCRVKIFLYSLQFSSQAQTVCVHILHSKDTLAGVPDLSFQELRLLTTALVGMPLQETKVELVRKMEPGQEVPQLVLKVYSCNLTFWHYSKGL